MFVSCGYKLDPESNWSLRDMPVDVHVEVSKTTLNFVVVLDSFATPCVGG